MRAGLSYGNGSGKAARRQGASGAATGERKQIETDSEEQQAGPHDEGLHTACGHQRGRQRERLGTYPPVEDLDA